MRATWTGCGSVGESRGGGVPPPPRHVVVVGSGFAGFECARGLIRLLGRQDADVTVTMISPVDYLLYTPLLPEVAGGAIDPRLVTVPLIDMLPGVRLIRAYVDSVDLSARTLRCRDQENTVHDVAWDRLVLTPGSISRLFDIPGLAEHARGLKSTAQALYLRDHILEQFELARIDADPERAAARKTIVVVGSSYYWNGTHRAVVRDGHGGGARLRIRTRRCSSDPRRTLWQDDARTRHPNLAARAERVLRHRGVQIRVGVTLARGRRRSRRSSPTEPASAPTPSRGWPAWWPTR